MGRGTEYFDFIGEKDHITDDEFRRRYHSLSLTKEIREARNKYQRERVKLAKGGYRKRKANSINSTRITEK
jgi:hypothetical protein